MSGIYWDKGVKLKSYGATTKGERSTVRIDLEVTDVHELAYILRQCREINDEQKVKPKKLLALPDYSEGGVE